MNGYVVSPHQRRRSLHAQCCLQVRFLSMHFACVLPHVAATSAAALLHAERCVCICLWLCRDVGHNNEAFSAIVGSYP